jgi:hypothetical protein
MLPQTRSAALACALGTIVSFLGPLRAGSSDYELVICCQFGALAWTGSEGATHVWACCYTQMGGSADVGFLSVERRGPPMAARRRGGSGASRRCSAIEIR